MGSLGRIFDENAQKVALVFKPLFLLTTFDVGNDYRRVHEAVKTCLVVATTESRSDFFGAPAVHHQAEGQLKPQASKERPLPNEVGLGLPSVCAGAVKAAVLRRNCRSGVTPTSAQEISSKMGVLRFRKPVHTCPQTAHKLTTKRVVPRNHL